MKKDLQLLPTLVMSLMLLSTPAGGATWNMSTEYSTTRNPNGAWSYGRRLSPTGDGFDLMSYNYGNTFWLLGSGIWQPSIQSGPDVWADNNTHGYPVVRWTCSTTGSYKIETSFIAADTRGEDVLVWVITGGTPIFSSEMHGYPNSTSYTNTIVLQQGAYIDWVVKWDDRQPYRNANWTVINGTVSSVPQPSTILDIRTSQVEICWDTATNSWYQLQYRSTLTTNNWVPFSTNWIPGTGTRFCTNDSILPGLPQRYYRALVTNSPPQL